VPTTLSPLALHLASEPILCFSVFANIQLENPSSDFWTGFRGDSCRNLLHSRFPFHIPSDHNRLLFCRFESLPTTYDSHLAEIRLGSLLINFTAILK